MNRPQVPLNLYFLSCLVFLLAWLSCSHVHAATNHALPISPYEAEYEISWHGLKAGTSIHRLEKNSDQTYTVESRTIPRFNWVPLHFVERSQFTWQQNDIKPLHYYYDLKEARKHKKGAVVFDWTKKRVRNTISPEPWDQAMPEGIQDKLTHALKLRLNLIKNKDDDLKFIVAEDDEIKPYQFYIVAHERTQTRLGWLDTTKVTHTSRSGKQFTMWLASSFEYAPVKVAQSKNGSVFAQGEITTYKKLKNITKE